MLDFHVMYAPGAIYAPGLQTHHPGGIVVTNTRHAVVAGVITHRPGVVAPGYKHTAPGGADHHE